MTEIVESVFKGLIKKTARARRRLETRSPNDSEASGTGPDSPTSQPSPLKATSRVTTAREFETLYNTAEGDLNEGRLPKRQETWDHWYLAPETNMAIDTAPELLAIGKQATLSSPTSISHSPNPLASIHDFQETATASAFQEHNDHTTDHEKDFTEETSYHRQATLNMSESSAKPGNEMDAGFADIASYPSGDEDIVDISEKLARMPGAFPADYTESAALADMQLCLYREPGPLYIYQDFIFIKNANGTLRCEKLVDYNWKAVHEDRYNIPDLRVPLINENSLLVSFSARPQISDELFSRVTFHSGAELQCSAFASAPTRNGNTQTGSAGPGSSYGDANNDASRGSASTGSSPIVSASSETSWSGYPSISACGGTAVFPFTPSKFREHAHSNELSTYQSITAMLGYKKDSFEELRLADYNGDRRSVKQEVSGVVEEDSDWDTSSSMSENDRPQAKQRALEKELQNLSMERNWYDYGLKRPKMGSKTPEQRLKRLSGKLHAVESLPIEKPQHLTWDNWQEEPSEDDSEDGSWHDAHGRETVIEDAENPRERNINSKSAGEIPEYQQEPRPGSGTRLSFTNSAKISLAAYSKPTEQSNLPESRFSSFKFDIARSSQGFTFTVPPSKSQSPFSSIQRFGGGASKSTYRVPLASSPVDSEGDNNSELREDILASSDDDLGKPKVPKERVKRMKPTEDANTTTTQPLDLARFKQHDDRGRSQMVEDVNVPANKAPQAKLGTHGLQQAKDKTIDEAHVTHATSTHARTTTPDSAIEIDNTQPSNSRVDDTLARTATGQIALAIGDTAHEWEDEEDPGNDADISDNEGRHRLVPAVARGVDGRLGLGKKREGSFWESSFLGQRWNFDVEWIGRIEITLVFGFGSKDSIEKIISGGVGTSSSTWWVDAVLHTKYNFVH